MKHEKGDAIQQSDEIACVKIFSLICLSLLWKRSWGQCSFSLHCLDMSLVAGADILVRWCENNLSVSFDVPLFHIYRASWWISLNLLVDWYVNLLVDWLVNLLVDWFEFFFFFEFFCQHLLIFLRTPQQGCNRPSACQLCNVFMKKGINVKQGTISTPTLLLPAQGTLLSAC